eukprot:TRINITY_DN26296_c0_g1_i1.p1 TRINITY_DN26296_c0_g1~~TRINITY_DN26296_c0_g1_i1.p1  ORF type:complete len:335 (-),score=123.45 TRINITY_DN26296_c0_g1_i1:180-1184(-)
MAPLPSKAAVAALLFAPTSLALSRGGKIVPELKDYPLSDKAGQDHDDFFDKDNPSDDRLGVHKDFPHAYPWPKLQHPVSYDTDYVKDENSDHGEWQVKMDYDVSRNKYRSREIIVENLQKTVDEHTSNLNAAESDESQAASEAAKQQAVATQAQKDAAAAQARLEELAGKVGSEGGSGAIGSAQAAVDDAIKKFEECQKQLEDAKAELKRLIDERDAKAAAAAAAAANSTNTAEDLDKAISDKKAAVEAAETVTKEEETSVADLRKQLREAEAKLDVVRKRHSESARQGVWHPPGPDSAPAPPPPTPAPVPAGASRSAASVFVAAALFVASMAA